MISRRRIRVFCLAFGSAVIAAFAHAQTPAPAVGDYARLDTFCGPGPIPRNVATLPFAGCFLLTADHTATGRFAGHDLRLSVDRSGRETLIVDATTLENRGGATRTRSGTNLPFVHPQGAGYALCNGDDIRACPTNATIIARNRDRSVLFQMVECLPPTFHVCVGTQANWDAEMVRRK